MMSIPRRAGIAAGLAAVCAGTASGAEMKYPNRPIRFVVGFLPGGPSDTIARVEEEKKMWSKVIRDANIRVQ